MTDTRNTQRITRDYLLEAFKLLIHLNYWSVHILSFLLIQSQVMVIFWELTHFFYVVCFIGV